MIFTPAPTHIHILITLPVDNYSEAAGNEASSDKPEEFGNAGADKEGEAVCNGAAADGRSNDGSPPPAKKLKDGKGKAQDPHPYSYSHHRY
jgi:hypothetical protein